MPYSAVNAGAEVAIGWSEITFDNHMNDWIDVFFSYMNSIDSTTNMLYTAKKAYNRANAEITLGNANTAKFYGNENFRLSDIIFGS